MWSEIFSSLLLISSYCGSSWGYAFESCSDSSTSHGNCTVVEKDGALGSESINSVWLQNGGYSDFGQPTGCPYQAGACKNGFSFYGWVKFRGFVSPCENYGVYVTNQQFAIHLLGNGRLAAYAWMDDDSQWYAESAQPISLNIWYPLILQFDYNSLLGNGTLYLVSQNQLVAFSNCTNQRTYKPPLPNHLFGSDGVSANHSTSIQIDRTNWDGLYRPVQDLIAILFDPPARTGNCQGKSYSTLTRQFQCFWLENGPLNWTDAYRACNKASYDAGYPYGRLARFASPFNKTFLNAIKSKLGTAPAFVAWIGAGNKHWLNASMQQVIDLAVSLPDVTYSSSTGGCAVVNTKVKSWQLQEMNCSATNAYICEMSWDCALVNPCQNFGTCIPLTDGPTCSCSPGTSGTFCEKGSYNPWCNDQCPCKAPYHGTCMAPPDYLKQLSAATDCQKSLTSALKKRMVTLDLMYNSTLEDNLRAKFYDLYNQTYNGTQLERNYGSKTYSLATWISLLKYRMHAKINKWFVDAMCSDQSSTQTSILVQKYNSCVQKYVQIFNGTQISAAVAKRQKAERNLWTKILGDDEFP